MRDVKFDIEEWNTIDIVATFYIAIDAIKGRPRKYGVTFETFDEIEKEVKQIVTAKGLNSDTKNFEIQNLFDTDEEDPLFGDCSVYLGLRFEGKMLDASGYEKYYGDGAAFKAMQILRESRGMKRRAGYMAKAVCHVDW